jgi:serine/threonine protein kinase
VTPSVLYRDPVPVNPVLHRNKRVSKLTDFSVAKAMHAVFLAAAEFEHAAL